MSTISTSTARTPDTDTAATVGPDLNWRTLWRWGGISALGYLVVSILVPGVLVLAWGYDLPEGRALPGSELLDLVGNHQGWWMALQVTTLEGSILAIITFLALFTALKHLEPGWAAIGAAFGVVSMILYMAYLPVLLGQVWLGQEWLTATAERRTELATAAESLIAQNSAFNPAYEPLTAIGILVLSLVMLRGVFSRWVAWLGVATAVAAFAAVALYPVLGLGYLWWWVFYTAWFIAVGWQLIRLSRPRTQPITDHVGEVDHVPRHH
jgi:hypothetical protein